MALSSKGSRNIVVDGVHYRWRAAGNDDFISLVICPRDLPGGKVVCTFGYHHTQVPLGGGQVRLVRQLVITARIVRRVVLHALGKGYDPRVKAPELDLRSLDDVIDISDAERGRGLSRAR